MKMMFIAVMLMLLAAGVVTVMTEPDARSDVPVLYWATDPNPARIEQVDLFHEWLVEEGHTNELGRPLVSLRLDTVSGDSQKLIIQGISGVAADILDRGVPQLESYGLLADLSGAAQRLGFGTDQTYPALEDWLVVEGRQYGFPCNVATPNFWVNVDTFRAVGMEAPPQRWDFDTFERIGKEFVARANVPGERQTVFFCNALTGWGGHQVRTVMHRSLGLSIFNETLTASTVDDERYVRVLERIRKWTYEDRLLPTAADVASISGATGLGGVETALFHQGQYAMITMGRWMLIRLRQFDNPPDLSISQFPFETFENSTIMTRAAGLYAGGPHQELASLFLAFLASERYNMHIVECADSQPPNPKYALSEAFLNPPDHPNEWLAHERIAEIARTVAIADTRSPYVEQLAVSRALKRAGEEVMSGRENAGTAAQTAAWRINEEIRLNIAQSPALRAHYLKRVELQKKIDEHRMRGEPVPAEWLFNPFHRRYYSHKGWVTP